MGYVSFRGVSTQNLNNVYVQLMPSHKKAGKRMTEYRVKGRDGVLHTDEGFDNFDITIRLVMINAGAETRQLINAWADGTGKLISSDDLTRCWKATVIDEISFSRVAAAEVKPEQFSATKAYSIGDYVTYEVNVFRFIANHSAGEWNPNECEPVFWRTNGLYDTAEITFNCQPHMYEAEDSEIELTDSDSLVNPGTDEALPLIKVEGTGTCDFNFCGDYIIIYEVDPDDPVFIDCETGYIYTQGGTAKEMTGNIPHIPMGESNVVFDGNSGLSTITITPRWRWV